jgi:hypothetical protein
VRASITLVDQLSNDSLQMATQYGLVIFKKMKPVVEWLETSINPPGSHFGMVMQKDSIVEEIKKPL